VAVSLRAATKTHGSLAGRRAFTVNVPPERLVDAVDHAGTTSGRDEDKFRSTSLTPVRSVLVDAPYVEECPLVLECRLVHTLELGLHTLFVGEILDAKADEDCLGPGGLPDPARLRPVLYASGTSSYLGVGAPLAKAFGRRT
jgi:flavin reductase (DIM6/NTAB) family NADH-FMN oxidoreductase RutF